MMKRARPATIQEGRVAIKKGTRGQPFRTCGPAFALFEGGTTLLNSYAKETDRMGSSNSSGRPNCGGA